MRRSGFKMLSIPEERLPCMELVAMITDYPASTIEQAVSILLESLDETERRVLAAIEWIFHSDVTGKPSHA